MGYLSLALRLLLALVFMAALVGKLSGRRAVRAFGRLLADVGVPPRLVEPAAAGLVGAELSVVVLAPWPATGLVGALVAAGLLAMLTGGVTRAVRRGTTASCRCFGVHGGRLRGAHAVRNAALTAVAVVAVLATVLSGEHGLHPAGGALSFAAAALGALVVVAWDDLIAVVAGHPSRSTASSRRE